MYLQITTKCNMRCEHCCFNCEPGKGEHMSREVWELGIELCKDYDSKVAIGGGEPTLHPEFNDILLEAIAASGEYTRPFIVTNGTNKKRALLLHKLHKAEIVEAHLSTDQYHEYDMVDHEVREAFGHDDWDCGRQPINVGRWAESQEIETSGCACPDQLIQTDGQIRYCGCLDAPIIGDVWNGITEEYECGCFKDHDL